MPIGADGGLPKRSGSRASPLSFPGKPPMISDASMQSQTNNTMASAAGAGRMSLMGGDRAGISRGRGHAARADMAQAMANAQSQTQAAGDRQQALNSNAAARLQYDTTRRAEDLQNQGMLERIRNAREMTQVARKGLAMNLSEANARGKFGLDSIYLDKTPLLSALLR